MIDLSGVEGILGEIGRRSQERVNIESLKKSQSWLKDYRLSGFVPKDFAANLRKNSLNVIAEVKKASPSKGEIAPNINPVDVASQYLSHGASALSVLTEPDYFKGDISYLRDIREAFPDAYILMKDFFVDPYQLHQALWAGADAILIIVALLGRDGSQGMYYRAKELGLTPLVEVHDERELRIALDMGASLVGINNRNLKDLSISLSTTERLIKNINSSSVTVIGESGIKSRQDLLRLKGAGCNGFLVGSSLMESGSPGESLARLLSEEEK